MIMQNETLSPKAKIETKVKKQKVYKINVTHTKRGTKLQEGTIEELTKYNSYTLEIGNSRNRKIDRKPKTINSFIKNLNNAYSEIEGACYERTYVKLTPK